MQTCGWREGVKLHLAVKVCVQVRMAAVGLGCEDHSCFLHAGVPGTASTRTGTSLRASAWTGVQGE